MFVDGLKFGLLLQLAVGPMCLLVFNTAGNRGFAAGMVLVSAIALVDALYILLAGAGVSAILSRENVRRGVKIVGGTVLLLFGLDIATGALGFSLLPQVSLFSNVHTGSLFLQGVLLTASNPLTIVFWGGVFSTKAAAENMSAVQLCPFGLGCVSATLFFLSAIALLGNGAGVFLPPIVLTVLNVTVGCVIVYFAVKMMRTR